MIALIQRTQKASVSVAERPVSSIGIGILALVGVEKTDTEREAKRLCERLLGYRIFADTAGKMNLSLQDLRGELLLVPQFTLVADTQKGLRPSFSSAADPFLGARLFKSLADACCDKLGQNRVATGIFGADMQVALVNDGPVTFLLSVSSKS